MQQSIKIGTRSSNLALWQAKKIQSYLSQQNIASELVLIESSGEENLISPLYEIGIVGIFTKELDIALLDGRIDIAVHSLKDVPTSLPEGLQLASVPNRGSIYDTLMLKDKNPEEQENFTIATSSLRRKAQWLDRFPSHTVENIRGNVNTRIDKFNKNANLDACLFAETGLDRLEINQENCRKLDWMIPAPGQGALAVVTRIKDKELTEACKVFEDKKTRIAVNAERLFLKTLNGGCTLPIGGNAYVENDKLLFKGIILTEDGTKNCKLNLSYKSDNTEAGKLAAEHALENGAAEIIATFT